MKNLKDYELESGEVVKIPPISQIALTLQIKREMPPPEPPVVEVEIAGEKTMERNYAHPDYEASLERWNQLIMTEVTERALKRIAIQQKLTPEQQAEVDELREVVGEDELLPANDKVLWLTQVACNDADLQALLVKSSNIADPSEKGVQAAADNFPGDVPAS